RFGAEALGVLGLAALDRDDLAVVKEGIGDRDRLLQRPARGVAQVDHVALELVGRDRDVLDRLAELIDGRRVALADAEIADVAAFGARADRPGLDAIALERQLDRPAAAGTHDRQRDLLADLSVQLGGYLI